MKLVVAGSREFTERAEVWREMDRIHAEAPISEVINGGCRGADRFAGEWAQRNGVPERVFLPDWSGLGAAAGPIRNQQMVDYGDALLAFWDGKSRGTGGIIAKAMAKGMVIHAVYVVIGGPP